MKKSAFSLLELSVALVIISLLMAIVSQGIRMVASSRLTTARALTSKSPVPTIPGLVAWYETSSTDSFKAAEAIDGKQLSTWYDISPDSIPARKNTLTRTPSSVATYFAKGIGNLPSVKFNGAAATSADGFTLANFYQGATSQNTIFIVASTATLSESLVSMMLNSARGASFSATSFGPLGIEVHLLNNTTPQSTPPIVLNAEYIINSYYNGASSKVYLNDASNMLGGATFDGGTSTANFLVGLTIGSYDPWSFNGLMSEVIIYNRPLAAQERKDVMRYLSKKYGIKVTGL